MQALKNSIEKGKNKPIKSKKLWVFRKKKYIAGSEECLVLNWGASLKQNFNSQECSKLVE